MASYLTAQQVRELTQTSVQAVHQRAKREGWLSRTVPGRGRPRKEYLLTSMPADIQLRYEQGRAECLPARSITRPAQPLKQRQINNALAKADLLRIYRANLSRAGWGKKVAARKAFMRAYNSGAAAISS